MIDFACSPTLQTAGTVFRVQSVYYYMLVTIKNVFKPESSYIMFLYQQLGSRGKSRRSCLKSGSW